MNTTFFDGFFCFFSEVALWPRWFSAGVGALFGFPTLVGGVFYPRRQFFFKAVNAAQKILTHGWYTFRKNF